MKEVHSPSPTPSRSAAPPPAPGIRLDDIYYTLFRHKWLILGSSLAGILAAATLYFVRQPPYTSQARLLIRYVLETKSLSPAATADTQIKQPDSRGENIMNSEMEILTSLDLAAQVADLVGSERVLAQVGGGSDRMAAAGVIRGGLTVEVPRRSDIIRVAFEHPDSQVVVPVLRSLVDTYLRRHGEIHQGKGVLDEYYTRKSDDLRSKLRQTEDELKKLKADARIISVEDSKRAYAQQISKIMDGLMTAEVELAERKSVLGDLEQLSPTKASDTNTDAIIPPDKLSQYSQITSLLDTLTKRERELLGQFTEEHPSVKSLRGQITSAEREKSGLETQFPRLTALNVAHSGTNTFGGDFTTEVSKVNALQARIRVYSTLLTNLQAEASQIVAVEPDIIEKQRLRDLQETSYRYYSSTLEQSKVDESLGAGKITNISIVENPTPPGRNSKKLLKLLAGVLAGGLGFGLGLAFALDFVLDRSLRRGTDVERHLRVPFFMSIPDTHHDGGFRWPWAARNGHARVIFPPPEPTPASEDASPPSPASGPILPWAANDPLRPYCEALRDRLITYFEVHELNHKPKLLAVTGCRTGAGVSTLAAGLAASLSETGDGNVLLVDMNLEQGAAHPFYKGSHNFGLSQAFEAQVRDQALVQENLYLVSVNEPHSARLPRALPKRFSHLVPKMKASDYDYIIFDMPPVTQTSITPRLATYMDMVLLVIESGQTSQDAAVRANVMLTESRANVAAVLNKTRSYVPALLAHDL